MNIESAKQARDKSILLAELLDHNVSKSEREHVAAAEIERLRVWNNRWRDLAAKLQLSFKDWAMDL